MLAGTLDPEHAGAAWARNLSNRILCVDDDPVIRCLVDEQLTGAGFDVVTLGDGDSAWVAIKAESFDLALIDLAMPGVDGFGLIERIRNDRELADMPLIVITSNADAGSVSRAFAVGATSFITKPINWPLLTHQVQFVLRAHETEAALESIDQSDTDCPRQKDKVLRGLGNELKTPLHHIIGFGEIVRRRLEDLPAPRDVVEHMDSIVGSGERLLRVLTDIVLVAELGSGDRRLDRQMVKASELIAQVSARTAELGETKGAALDFVNVAESIELDCDFDLLSRALVQLVEFAVESSGEAVLVRFGAVEEDSARLKLFVERSGLADHEPGSRNDDAGALGAESEVAGVGADHFPVGLAFAQTIADLHGWRIEGLEKDGDGFRASISVPVVRRQKKIVLNYA